MFAVRIHLLLLYWQTAAVDLRSRPRFSAVSNIIPASQVLRWNLNAPK